MATQLATDDTDHRRARIFQQQLPGWLALARHAWSPAPEHFTVPQSSLFRATGAADTDGNANNDGGTPNMEDRSGTSLLLNAGAVLIGPSASVLDQGMTLR